MPPVIVGVAVGYAAYGGAITLAGAIAIGIGAAALTYAATPKFDAPNFANEAYGQQQMLRSPVEPRRGIYGRAMVSGPLIFAEESGTDSRYLHLIIALAGHPCDAVEKIYFGDELAWENGTLKTKFAEVARLTVHLGDHARADPQLTAQCPHWTADHIGIGVTYLYARLKFDTEIYPNGVPNIKALVRGKRLYDPRLDSSVGGSGAQRLANPATWSFSDNWALCCLDYTLFESGVGAAASEIDLATYANAANDSDALVEYQTATFEKRYRCNGTYTHDTSPASVMEKMLTAGAGMQVYVSGQYRLYAGVYQGPEVLVLTENDAAGAIEVRPRTPRSDLCNAVRGTFVDPANFYQPTDFAPYENAFYRQQDGEYIDHDVDFPFTQSASAAQRLAKLYLEQRRAGMQVSLPVAMIGLAVSVGKVVGLSLPRLGIEGSFQVIAWEFDYGKPVSLLLAETSSAVYDFALGEFTERDLVPNVVLPDPRSVPTPTALGFSSASDSAQWSGILDWQAPSGGSYRYQVQVFAETAPTIALLSVPTYAPTLRVPRLDAGEYRAEVVAINLFANRSAPALLNFSCALPPEVTAIDVSAGPLSLLLAPQTAQPLSHEASFELKGSQSLTEALALPIGSGKTVLWANLHPGRDYFVWARSRSAHGVSPWFGPINAKTSTDSSAVVELVTPDLLQGFNYDVFIESSHGDTFKPGQSFSTTLTARVFRNGSEVTETLSPAQFRWRRRSHFPQPPPNDDGTWDADHTAGFKSIVVTVSEVYARATFSCDISSF